MPLQKAKAVIWDMDGVIVDSGPYHCRAWQYVFHKRGVEFTEEDFQHHFGQRNDTIIRSIMGDDVSLDVMADIAEEKEAKYRELVGQNIKAQPGAIELIETLGKDGFGMAIGSSAPMENIQLILQALDIEKCFQAIVYGREVTEGKPSPQVFLLAAEKLGVKPENCIVIEDAVAGVAGAKKAGMKCIAVTATHDKEKLVQADIVVDSLITVSLKDIENLLR